MCVCVCVCVCVGGGGGGGGCISDSLSVQLHSSTLPQKNCEIHMIMRKDLNEQCVNRDHECKHCRKKDTYINIVFNHDYVCEKKIVPCSNAECTETMEQASLKKHLEKCKYTEISCRYKCLGCHTKMKRNDMGAH